MYSNNKKIQYVLKILSYLYFIRKNILHKVFLNINFLLQNVSCKPLVKSHYLPNFLFSLFFHGNIKFICRKFESKKNENFQRSKYCVSLKIPYIVSMVFEK